MNDRGNVLVLVGSGLLILFGLFTLVAVRYRWAWFVGHFKVRGVYERLGDRGAAVIYGVLGGVMIVLGVYIVFSR